jgi:hypothetical protein
MVNSERQQVKFGRIQTGATTRDRITGQVMPMPATRMVETKLIEQLVADQAHGQTLQLELGVVGRHEDGLEIGVFRQE